MAEENPRQTLSALPKRNRKVFLINLTVMLVSYKIIRQFRSF
jgi:hypothetical protein